MNNFEIDQKNNRRLIVLIIQFFKNYIRKYYYTS